jgi:hypothetical protein
MRDTRPEIDVDDPDASEQIHRALVAGNADIVINENDVLIWTHDGHFHDLNHWVSRELCLSTYICFMRNGKPISLPKRLGKEFIEQLNNEDLFKREFKGPCPVCAAKMRR